MFVEEALHQIGQAHVREGRIMDLKIEIPQSILNYELLLKIGYNFEILW